MKICYVALDVEVPYTGVGGSGGSVHAYEVAKNLVKRGHKIELICMKAMRTQEYKGVLEDIKIHRIYTGADKVKAVKERSERTKRLLNGLAPILKKSFYMSLGLNVARIAKDCDIIYERASSLGAGGIASLITGKPLVLEVNDPMMSNISLRLARKIVTTSRKIVKGSVRKKVIEVVWGCHTEMFHPRVDPSIVLEKYSLKSKKVLLYTGSFAPWHGVDTIIEAAKRLIHENIVFLMVGSGENLYKYEREVSRLGLSKLFVFTGAVSYEEMPMHICAADVAIAPFDPEKNELTKRYGFFYTPFKIFEYMACGRPIITTGVGNIIKILEDGKTAVFIKSGDAEALADSILKLLSDDDLRTRIGETAGREVKKHSWEEHVKILEEIFYEVKG